ncbi:MAG: methyltransferase [Betaproteobacteria bacterium HGW-Betaproteobacteria-12]|nr:MAG: methyltransferase [Betaproteobacteria bacterium HGW-Betaproteobacteria-12]
MKLHLGCGRRYIPGFVHIDAMEFPHVDYVQAIDRLDNIQDNSVDLIYVCHVLEHFKRGEVKSVLQEWYRVIRPGGLIRISVPDFRALAELYVQMGRLDLVVGPVCGRQDHQYNVHYNIFDFSAIKELLESVGFQNIALYDWQTTEHADIDDFSQAYIPHMDKENGRLISLNVEAIKP